MTIWYKVWKDDDIRIQEVNVIKSTATRVWFFREIYKGKVEKYEGKNTEYYKYFERKSDAISYLVERQEWRIKGAKWEINDAGKKLKKLKAMKHG